MVTIRPAARTDLAQLGDLIRIFPSPTKPTEEYAGHCLSLKLEDSHSYLAVAEEGNQLLAYIAGHRHNAFYAGGQTAWCDELLVRENQRSHGIGRRMMESFEEWARRHGCVLVALATSGARGFYESIGYSSNAGYYKKYLL